MKSRREWLKGRHNVRITGATGVKAALINGVYKPTEEMCGNATIYQKVVGGKVRLEYHAHMKQWRVNEKEHKNKNNRL